MEGGPVTAFYPRFKPHILMVLTQIGYTFMYIITEASFNHGMNPSKNSSKANMGTVPGDSLLSLLGVSLTINMYFTSLKFTSSTLVACMVNTIASLTFILAVILRMEIVNARSPRGIAKILGTVVSLAGVMTMTLYKGPALQNIGHGIIHIKGSTAAVHKNWLQGSILAVASCITWSAWYIMQAYTLKRYPAQLSLTTWMNLVGAAQSAVYTVIVQHKKEAWTIGFDIDLWSTLYGGVVVSGIIIFIQLWCTEAKGPVFVTMFNPLSTILVALLAYFVLGEKLYVGSILGGVIVIMGLYLLLWGKEHDEPEIKLKEQEDPKTMILPPDENGLREEP
ncbi:UNVERIFIED_CONTAM: WAT1-related protein [Sesamum latifolium]|uniref:WAT1-related protein n=1 Tax=Sesamum latifolium TaxID=2727402 RepID=A0AAW2XTX2_9LAMI